MKPEDLARAAASKTIDKLTMLGEKTDMPSRPEDAVLEVIERSPGPFYGVRLSCPEFTSLCPKTGQPDFAHIVIDYAPAGLLIESEALKLFMASFRNHGSFREEVTNYIAIRLWDALNPHWINVSAFWYPRGGIPIDVFVQIGLRPTEVEMPPLDIPSYKGR